MFQSLRFDWSGPKSPLMVKPNGALQYWQDIAVFVPCSNSTLDLMIKKLRKTILIFTALTVAAPVVHARTIGERIASAAEERTRHSVTYDGSYKSIGYPMGDVDDSKGVCTDVVIRSFRAVGIDLQQEIHEDMKSAFSKYPDHWGLLGTDSNIDHRRVPNIQKYLERKEASLAITENFEDYQPGDLVTWNVALNLPFTSSPVPFARKNIPHIGVVSTQTNSQGRPLIVHNIGRGPVLDDMIFHFPITGHYRYSGS